MLHIQHSVLLEKKYRFERSRETHQIIKRLCSRGAVDNNIGPLNLTGNYQRC